jgi:hypothetical protein
MGNQATAPSGAHQAPSSPPPIKREELKKIAEETRFTGDELKLLKKEFLGLDTEKKGELNKDQFVVCFGLFILWRRCQICFRFLAFLSMG